MREAVREDDLHVAAPISAPEFTRLHDLDFYRLDASAIGMVQATPRSGWCAALQGLAKACPGSAPDMLALAVLSVYAARMTPGGRAVIGLRDSGRVAPVRLWLEASESFEDVLYRVAMIPLEAMVGIERGAPSCGGVVPLAVGLSGGTSQPCDRAEIVLDIREDGSLCWRHSAALRPEIVGLIETRMTALAESIAAKPWRAAIEHNLLSAAEYHLTVDGWNATDAPVPFDGGVVGLLEQVAERTPLRPALVYRGRYLDYSSLNARANRLARVLRRRGIASGSVVALCMERSEELAVALFAVLKAGGAFVLLNPKDPDRRLLEVMTCCGAGLVLTQAPLRPKLPDKASRVLVLPEGGDVDADAHGRNPRICIPPGDPACLRPVSSPEGRPVAAVLPHSALTNQIAWLQAEFPLSAEDRVLAQSPLGNDSAIREILWPLCFGACAVLAESAGQPSGSYLARLIGDIDVTHLHLDAARLIDLLDTGGVEHLALQRVFCAGAVTPRTLARFNETLPDAELIALSGPVEAGGAACYWQCAQSSDNTPVPLGRPVANCGLYILDERDRPVPVGVPGKLLVGGACLAEGYRDDKALTARRFVDNPISGARHARLFDTGIVACFRPDGEVLPLGDTGNALTVDGQRIEPAEIEATLRDEGVRDVVVTTERGAIVAYAVDDAPGEARAGALSAALEQRLPSAFLPRAIRFVAELPFRTDGSVDRDALPAMPAL